MLSVAIRSSAETVVPVVLFGGLSQISYSFGVLKFILSIRDRSVRVGMERMEAKPYNLQKI